MKTSFALKRYHWNNFFWIIPGMQLHQIFYFNRIIFHSLQKEEAVFRKSSLKSVQKVMQIFQSNSLSSYETLSCSINFKLNLFVIFEQIFQEYNFSIPA